MSAAELRQSVEQAALPTAQAGDWRLEVARLATLPPIEADRAMKETAEALGCRVSTLQAEVAKARGADVAETAPGAGRPLDLKPRPLSEHLVKGAELLDKLEIELGRHVVMSAEGRRAVALWIVFTYALDRADHAPRLRIKSPEKRCGKSTLLDFLLETCDRPLPLNNTSPSALFRTVELARPTLLIDEADSFMRDNEELRGLVNSGHRRTLAFVIRNVEVGGEFQPRRFSTWCAMAIAGIGGLHGTIEDRSVTIELRRKLPAERVERLDRAARTRLAELASKVARWVADSGAKIQECEPDMPNALNDRACDNWYPLLAIADVAGGEWPKKAREAAVKLSGGDLENSLATELLADIRNLFIEADELERGKSGEVDHLMSSDIVSGLVALEHRPWPEMPGTGKPLTARKLALLLGRFGIAPKHGPKGNVYRRELFTDAFGRYLADLPAIKPSQPSQLSENNNLAERQTFTPDPAREGSQEAKKPANSTTVKVVKVQPSGEAGPRWDDLDAWRLEIATATDLAGRKAALSRWAEAAGGRVNGTACKLPAGLPNGYALAELKSLAQRCGLAVEVAP